LVIPKGFPIEHYKKYGFRIDIAQLEEKYDIRIAKKSIPTILEKSSMPPSYETNIQVPAEIQLEKKLKKPYPYKQKGFKDKGILLLSIFNPLFAGFQNDVEIRCSCLLENLKKIAEKHISQSAFNQVMIVDSLSPLEKDPDRCIYELISVD